MLTKDEIEFLRSQGLTPEDVYDGRAQASAVTREAARAAKKRVVLGAPCQKGGHRLRTRAGHCIVCDTSKLAYQDRHLAAGFVYIAGSKARRLIKIGIAKSVDQRERNLNAHRYANTEDWRMLFHLGVETGGEAERRVHQGLEAFKIVVPYAKDGRDQDAGEVYQTSFSMALRCVEAALVARPGEKPWKSLHWRDYEF